MCGHYCKVKINENDMYMYEYMLQDLNPRSPIIAQGRISPYYGVKIIVGTLLSYQYVCIPNGHMTYYT